MGWKKYYRPKTTAEAMSLLQESRGNARVIAGGTDLMLQVKNQQVAPKILVDLSQVEELQGISESSGVIRIGAMVTHKEIEQSSVIRENARVLTDAARSIGSPQIRQVGTIGGNVVNAQPAADATIALMALGAQVRVLTTKGEEIRSLNELFLGPGKSTIDSISEIVLGFEFASSDKLVGSAFRRLAKRKALALPIVNVAVWVKTEETLSRFEEVRMSLGPMAPVPLRAVMGETVLKGAPFEAEVIENALSEVRKEINPRNSIRGSAVYKQEMAVVLLREALKATVKDLGGEVK